jgi:hypothetical protein
MRALRTDGKQHLTHQFVGGPAFAARRTGERMIDRASAAATGTSRPRRHRRHGTAALYCGANMSTHFFTFGGAAELRRRQCTSVSGELAIGMNAWLILVN